MNTPQQIEQIRALLQRNRGKFGQVLFVKADGSKRWMNFRQGVRNGNSPLRGGNWANTSKVKAKDKKLALVTDMDKEKEGKPSRRAIPLDRVISLKIGGEVFQA